MNKLMLVPESSSYKVDFNDGNISVKLSGGRSRVRKQSIHNSNRVDVSFTLTTDEYRYLMAFYRSVINRGALPFLMDIITETSELVTHKVTMVPNSFKLGSQKGHTYYVNFTVEAESLEENAEKDKQIIQNYESGKKPFTPPQQGWGNFFTPSELSPNATNVQDGIYRMDGDTVLSLRNAKGQIFQTKYTVNGIWTRYLHGGNWSSWLQLGSERVISTKTELYDSKSNLIRTFQGEGISGKIPDGDYTLRILDIYADGTTRVRSEEKTKIELGVDRLQVIPKQYGMTVTWNLKDAKSGHTEVWLGESNDVASAKLIAAVQWPAMEYEYSNATTARKYFFWIRHIDRRGVEGKMIGPVEGTPAAPFEQEFQNIRGDVLASKNAAIAHTDAEIKKLDATINSKIKNINIDTTQIDKAIKAATDKANEAVQSVVTETQQRKEAIEAEIRARNAAIGRAKSEVETSFDEYKKERKAADSVVTEKYNALTSRVGDAETKMTQFEQQKASKTEVATIAETALKSKWESAASQAKTDALAAAASDATQKANAAASAARQAASAARQAAETAAQAKADAAQQAAIAAASGDATAKANAAKAQAIADAAAKDAVVKQQAATDAKAKADKALADAKAYADGLNAASEAKISRLEQTRVTAAQAKAIAQSTVSARFQIPDTRNDNQPPTWYWTNYPRQTVTEFKTAKALGLAGSVYAALETRVAFANASGGAIFQTASLSDGKVWRRKSDTAHTYANGVYTYTKDQWTAWVQDETVDGAQAKADAVKKIADAADALSRANKANITETKVTLATATSTIARIERETSSTLNGMTTKVNELTTSVDGMSAKKAVTIDNNGYLTGFELLSDRTNGVPRGTIKFNVDSFVIGKDGENVKPFVVSGNTTAINGELVVNGQAIISKLNAGVIDGSKIKAGTITAAHLTSGSVTADKIAAGAIVATKIAANAITADKLGANVINGNHISAGVSIRAPRIVGGSLNIADKFVVSEDGEVQIRAFAGNVNKGMIIKNNTIFIYDEVGVLQMKIGYIG